MKKLDFIRILYTVYFIKGNASKEEIINIGKQLCSTNRKIKNRGNYVLLSVDLSLVPEETEIYYDPRYKWGYYVKTGIPPKAINVVWACNFKTIKEIQLK